MAIKKKWDNFSMMHYTVHALYTNLPYFNAEEFIVYACVRSFMNSDGFAYPSQYRIRAELVGALKESRIRKALKNLESVGLIVRYRTKDGTLYEIMDPVLTEEAFYKRFTGVVSRDQVNASREAILNESKSDKQRLIEHLKTKRAGDTHHENAQP